MSMLQAIEVRVIVTEFGLVEEGRQYDHLNNDPPPHPKQTCE